MKQSVPHVEKRILVVIIVINVSGRPDIGTSGGGQWRDGSLVRPVRLHFHWHSLSMFFQASLEFMSTPFLSKSCKEMEPSKFFNTLLFNVFNRDFISLTQNK